jgi:phenylalanyl-tRNA synthetase beta chain
MVERLQAAGLRPISTVVDLTNYVLMELGHPTHAFDLARLAGPEIRVRRARTDETIRTLDAVDRKLDADMLVIADRDTPQAVAGVMGGGGSEVSAATRTVVLESAYFAPASVRRTSKRLGLKTEASARFERGADIAAPVVAIGRVLALMTRIGAGRLVGPVVDDYPRPRQPVRLHLRRTRLAALLGVTVPDASVGRILSRLGLGVTDAPDGWDVVAPTFRVDLAREVDLIEEVGRHYGFDKLDSTFPVLTAPAPPPDPRVPRDSLVRRLMTAAGLSEAVTFGFVEARAAAGFLPAGAPPPIAIANPLSAKFDTLRPSLLPGLVDAVAHNRRHGRRDVRLFEIGTRFGARGETRGIAAAWTGNAGAHHWSGGARDVDFFDVKGLVERVCEGLDVGVEFETSVEPFLVAGQTARPMAGGTALGIVGQVSPDLAEARGLPRQDRVFVAELNLDLMTELRTARQEFARPLPRHPFVVRDLSIVVRDTLPATIIRGTIQTAGRQMTAPLVGVGFFDRYQGKGVPEDHVSISVRLTFQAPDRTLTDDDVQHGVDTILQALAREHGASQR